MNIKTSCLLKYNLACVLWTFYISNLCNEISLTCSLIALLILTSWHNNKKNWNYKMVYYFFKYMDSTRLIPWLENFNYCHRKQNLTSNQSLNVESFDSRIVMLIFKHYQLDSKEIKCLFQWWAKMKPCFLLLIFWPTKS
jgi:hypothetical protein